MSRTERPERPAFGEPLRSISDVEFARFQAWIQRESGIYLPESKRTLLVRRLGRRVVELGLDSFSAYYHRAKELGESETIAMIDCLCTHETSFFREAKQFELLATQILPSWASEGETGVRPRRVRAWSAACSTGEEPFSLAMLLASALPAEAGWRIEILASDLSTRALAQAKEAIWPAERATAIPESFRKRFLLRGRNRHEGKVKMAPEILRLVRFERINLAAAKYPVETGLDLIFCRNVLIYFDPATRSGVISRLARHLRPGGLLFLGHAENLAGATGPDLRPEAPNVYRRAASARAPGAA
jgi:chemotaxis protein methyltransferase CheR